MKIAFVDVYDPIPINSGGDWYRYQLLNELGIDNEVTEYYTLMIESKKGFFPIDINFNRSFLASKIKWSLISRTLEIFKPDYLFKNKILKSTKCDLVFFSTVCYHIGINISKINKVPNILVMHNIEWQYLKNSKSLLWIPMRFYEHYIIKNADAIIAISPKDAEYAKQIVANNNVFYIPPKVNSSIFNTTGPAYDYGKDKLNILFYGSLDREQNITALKFIIDTLMPSLHKNKLLDKIRLNIFGSGNPPESISLIRDDINFIGAVDDPGFYVRGADIVIVPLHNSGGIKIRLLESLSCGKYVIASSESIEGLPVELKNMLFVANSAEEYTELIIGIRNGTTSKKIDLNLINKYLKGTSLDEVLHSVLNFKDRGSQFNR